MNRLQQGHPEKGSQSHNFDVQSQEHQRIRNDPDYDDWTYGTEPLPKEGWLPKRGNHQECADG
ncbi:MAG: hypothetical protein F4X84_01095 [Synechococcus sp. SB0662_bin_45]|nr:hypothetical protein [Cyanobacteria bacterium MAG IRC3_bin_20]MCY3654050.1 hypothetical protein [Cyanobacteria bacterium MAG IRC1_bin_28]MDE0646617.1 hypothetical protein [Cyanobacteria bacterium MAG IRC4_bin_6]MXW11543.1 hypothetical protein [Synechococcus sp. SB0668_bin_13]MXX08048.1 hypothetical protein [Synechococcus sp. SB0667_bin_8]MXY62739.1 hypothetical protein [Synechococcus sp. SB0665_bin_28]MYE21000.1 hypothetical protein [Synechococcus sp. SB0662_bin_45]MYF20662.1 hypothetical